MATRWQVFCYLHLACLQHWRTAQNTRSADNFLYLENCIKPPPTIKPFTHLNPPPPPPPPPQIWWMTLKNNRAPLLHYIKLCAPFRIHWWIQTWVTVRKRSIRVKISQFLSCVTFKFDGWPWKTIGHFFFAASSLVHHFIAISEFKLELQSRNAQFGSKSMIFLSGVTLKFDRWPWTRQIWGIWKLRPAYSPETPNSGQKRWCFVPCDLEIWWMTLENNRAPLLCCFKLCATFHNHQWIQTGVAVQKGPISVKFDDF